MVYRGPSRGCHTCRKRRVKCDEVKPQCGNCIKRKQQCPGYRDMFDAVHKDETLIVSGRPSSKRVSKSEEYVDEYALADSESPSQVLGNQSSTPSSLQSNDVLMLIQPPRNTEADCLSYFFANYVNIPRDPSTNLFIEHILPLYLNASMDSALYSAVHAVAINVTQMWRFQHLDSYLARERYARAVTLLKGALQDPIECKSDDTLASVYLLDFYDSLNKRSVGFIETGTHQQGAVALLRHRGKENFRTPMSQRLFTALRSRHINFSLDTGENVKLDDDLLAEETAVLPSAKLDLINAEVVNLYVAAAEGPETMDVSLEVFYVTIMKRSLNIEAKLKAWRNSLPKSWQPMSVAAKDLQPSIRAAGVYGDSVDVYSSLTVSHIHNGARASHMGIIRLIALCKRELEELGVEVNPGLGPYLQAQMQALIDGFCASVPYHLGDRTKMTYPHEHSEYPHIPDELRKLASYVDPFGNAVEITQEDHIRAAAAMGGWFVMTPLVRLLNRSRLKHQSNIFRPGPLAGQLRPGQLSWIRGQLLRIGGIYGLTEATHEWKLGKLGTVPESKSAPPVVPNPLKRSTDCFGDAQGEELSRCYFLDADETLTFQ